MTYPTEPDKGSAQSHLARGEEALQMHPDLSKRELRLALPPAFDFAHAASLHRLYRERTRTVVLLGDELQCLDYLFVTTFADKILGCLLQSDDGDSSD